MLKKRNMSVVERCSRKKEIKEKKHFSSAYIQYDVGWVDWIVKMC